MTRRTDFLEFDEFRRYDCRLIIAGHRELVSCELIHSLEGEYASSGLVAYAVFIFERSGRVFSAYGVALHEVAVTNGEVAAFLDLNEALAGDGVV